MLEKYVEGLTEDEAIRMAMEKSGKTNRKDAIAYLRSNVPKESYYQTKVKKALQEAYPDAYIAKIAQGMYSQNGIPDILCIHKGHYFGFEIKRPVFGVLSAIQEQTIKLIRKAGGTAEVVTYPEEALRVVDEYFREK